MTIRPALFALLSLCFIAAARAQTQAPAQPAQPASSAAPTVTVPVTTAGARGPKARAPMVINPGGGAPHAVSDVCAAGGGGR